MVAVLVLFLFCVALWFLLWDISCWVGLCPLCSCFGQSCLALWSTRFGKRERELVYVFLLHLFVYFVCVNLCHVSIPLLLGDRRWLRLAIVALPGRFCWRFVLTVSRLVMFMFLFRPVSWLRFEIVWHQLLIINSIFFLWHVVCECSPILKSVAF